MATPLSIDQFKLAISPSDKDNVRVVDWMDRLQNSTQSGHASTARMEIIREMRRPAQASPSAPGAGTSAGASAGSSAGHNMDDSDDVAEDGEEATEEEEAEKVRNALPDDTVPIGLLANLSLDKENGKEKKKGKERQGSGTTSSATANKPEEDDNNVVRVSCRGCTYAHECIKGVANKEYFRPGTSPVAALQEW